MQPRKIFYSMSKHTKFNLQIRKRALFHRIHQLFMPIQLMTSRRLSLWWYLDVMQSTLMRSLRETIHRAISRKKLITLFVVFKIMATHTYINYHWTICKQNKSQVWPWLLVGIPTFEIRGSTQLLSQPNINRVMVSASWGITAGYPGHISLYPKKILNPGL